MSSERVARRAIEVGAIVSPDAAPRRIDRETFGARGAMTEYLAEITKGGDLTLMVVVAVACVGGLLTERILLNTRWNLYFLLGFPLGHDLVPIPLAPEGSGRTASVRWAVDTEAGLVRFWSQPGERGAPMGLHGAVQLVRGRAGGVHLPMRWAPPWTPFLALLWFAGLGVARGQGHLTVPIAILLVAVLAVLYRQAALRAARELRWAFVSGEDESG